MEILLPDRELDVMEVLWERSNATAAEVREAMADELAYNTVLTFLRRLEQKGFVAHTEEGRTHRYHPLIGREQVRRSVIQRMLDRVFDGSPELLLTHLVSARNMSEADIRGLRDLLQKLRRGDS